MLVYVTALSMKRSMYVSADMSTAHRSCSLAKGSLDAHGLEPLLLYKLLEPHPQKKSRFSPKSSTRVSWAGSSAMDLLSPKPSGMELDDDGRPNDKSVQPN